MQDLEGNRSDLEQVGNAAEARNVPRWLGKLWWRNSDVTMTPAKREFECLPHFLPRDVGGGKKAGGTFVIKDMNKKEASALTEHQIEAEAGAVSSSVDHPHVSMPAASHLLDALSGSEADSDSDSDSEHVPLNNTHTKQTFTVSENSDRPFPKPLDGREWQEGMRQSKEITERMKQAEGHDCCDLDPDSSSDSPSHFEPEHPSIVKTSGKYTSYDHQRGKGSGMGKHKADPNYGTTPLFPMSTHQHDLLERSLRAGLMAQDKRKKQKEAAARCASSVIAENADPEDNQPQRRPEQWMREEQTTRTSR
ncbi:hypothetical protein MKZ38_005100 [Zalerion maritima]|uniref:Uncharacterized protein n=1 Tax=Zalerion maritima TaxID=339359 RepID=A0AAD5RKQ8_9PEZI|nr:hypothetical protein MKZ38_005100 [Zalerion maritima]